jgi:hypothetical protein
MKRFLRMAVFGPMWLVMVSVLVVVSPMLFFFSWISDDGETFGLSDFSLMIGDLAESMGLS